MTDYNAIISKYGTQFGIPTIWIETTIMTESSDGTWPPKLSAERAHNEGDGYGLMQVLYSTAKGLGYVGSPEGLFDPDTNILYGVKLLAQLKRSYGTDLRRIYSAYNSGKPDLWLSSSQVKANVERFMRNLNLATKRFVDSLGPATVAAAGAAGGGILAAVLVFIVWQWNTGLKGR